MTRRLPSSWVGRTWTALLPTAVVVVVVLVFVLENSRHTRVNVLFWSAALPLGVALLGAAALGGLAVFLLGSVRIVQLRRLASRRSSR
ncbi:putative integral membrane protein [Motilibacter rhizosphaerae]|uniref:Putative integral membrane protein n=1 Tax=Motilibacter rhizosphaerae TaxID=598652 RepID=A0A4Q7NXK4_9ACTN|nr:putative integral membrane protein [Motilibacter rhizosphaerae]